MGRAITEEKLQTFKWNVTNFTLEIQQKEGFTLTGHFTQNTWAIYCDSL